jgi:hypothetical protein
MVAQTANSNPEAEKALKKLAGKFGLAGDSLGEMVYGFASQRVASRYAPNVEKLSRNIAEKYTSKENANKIAKFAAGTWLNVVPAGYTIYKSSVKFRKTTGSYLNLSKDYRRSLAASGATSINMMTGMRTDLEVIKNDRSLLGKKAKNDTKSMLLSLLLDIPNILSGRLKTTIDKLNPRKIRNDKTGKAQKIADETHKQIDGFLDKHAVDGEGVDREYDGFLDSALRMANDDEGLESLNDRKTRYKTLLDFKSKYLSDIITLTASTLKPTLTQFFNVQSESAYTAPTAGKMIMALEKELKKNPSPVSLGLPGASNKNSTLSEYITDIFVQHHKDCGRGEMTKRTLGQLRQASTQIAEAIADPQRQMHAQALVLLVDKKHGIGNFNKGELNGFDFGPELEGYLADLQQKSGMSRRKRFQPPEKVYKSYQAARDDFVESWGQLTDEEKFLWSTFMPNEILLDIGVSKAELHALRHQENDLWQEVMEEILNEMGKLKADELQEIGLNEGQIELLAEAVKESGRNSSTYLQKNRHAMTDLLGDAATLMEKNRSGFLQEILSRPREKRDHKRILEERNQQKSLAERASQSKKSAATERSGK